MSDFDDIVSGLERWPLTGHEQQAVSSWVDWIVEGLTTRGLLTDDQVVEANESIYRTLVDQGPVLPKAMAAMQIENACWPDRSNVESDPPEDGFVARAIEGAVETMRPIAKAWQPYWYRHNIDPGEGV